MSILTSDLREPERQIVEGLMKTIAELRARVAELEAPWRNADSHDWDFLLRSLGGGGQGSFWRAVLTEARAVLAKGRAA